MAAQILYYHSTVLCTCKCGISAGNICLFTGSYILTEIYVSLYRLSLAAFVAIPITIHSSLLRRERKLSTALTGLLS